MVNLELGVMSGQENLEIIMLVSLEATKQETLEKIVLEILVEFASAGQVNFVEFVTVETLAEFVEQVILGIIEKNVSVVFVGMVYFVAIAEENYLDVVVVKPGFVEFVNAELENLEFAFSEQHHLAAAFVELCPVEVVEQHLNGVIVIFEQNLFVATAEFLEAE